MNGLKEKLSQQLKTILETEETVLLSFSCGKDSIAVWLFLREHFPKLKVIPYFLYLIDGLSFIDEAIDYYQKFFATEIIKLPHPSFFRLMDNAVFLHPENLVFSENNEYMQYDYDVINQGISRDLGYDKTLWCAVGTNQSDSIIRRTFFKKYGDVRETNNKIFPIAYWARQEIYDIIRENNCKLAKDYQLFGRTFDGFDYRFLYPIKKHHPEDYKKILEVFPLAEAEIKRGEFYERRKN